MVLENLFGAIRVHTTETSIKTTFMGKANTYGLTEESTKASGSTIRWKATACLLGATAVDMWANTKTTKSMDKALSNGQMVGSILDNGAKGNNTDKVLISRKVKREKAPGTWEKELSGLKLADSEY
jgi:hypothetical protein